MSIKDGGGPAFPLKEPLTCDSEGMTLRDYFAAKAMQSLVPLVEGAEWKKTAAEIAYEIADAMIEARKQ